MSPIGYDLLVTMKFCFEKLNLAFYTGPQVLFQPDLGRSDCTKQIEFRVWFCADEGRIADFRARTAGP